MKRQLQQGVLLFLGTSGSVFALGTSFTYQGRLAEAGSPATGIYDLQLTLYDAATGGTEVGTAIVQEDVTVTGGLFTVTLDFGGAAFDGNDRWLEVGVRPGSSTGAFTTLIPRQALTAAPYALHAAGLGCSACVSGAELDFDPATQAELNSHKTSGDHDGRYVLKAGDTMTGALTLPANGLVAGGSQLVLSGGNVGIGTAGPTARLDVRGGSAAVEGTVAVGGDYTYVAAKTRYLNIYPSQFRPADPTVTFAVDNLYGADVRISTGCCPGVLAAPVSLPNGVTVTDISCGILDNVADVPVVALMRKGMTGTGPNLAMTVSSPGNSPSIQTMSAAGSVAIDNNTFAYALAFRIGDVNTTCLGACKLYGCKMTYTTTTVN